MVFIGIGFISVVTVVLSLGANGPFIPVTALVSAAGDALAPGDEVRFRNVVVGSVIGNGEVAGGGEVQLNLHVDPVKATMIPANVTARAMPTSIFGAQYIDLIQPAGSSSDHLISGSVVQNDTSPGATQLQTALSQVDALLKAIEPAKLDEALTSLAQALQGQGSNIGNLVQKLDGYLQRVTPSTPQLQADVSNLSTVLQELSINAPDVLQTLSNLVTTGGTIVAEQQQLTTLISGGTALSADTTQLLQQNGARLITVVNDLQPVLAAIDANPSGLSNGVIELDRWFKAWSTALGQGPYARIAVYAPQINATQAINASEQGWQSHSSPGAVAASNNTFEGGELNPTPYSAAQNCPRYPGAAGPNCPGGNARATLASSPDGGSLGANGSAEEQQAIDALLAARFGPAALDCSAINDLLAGPLFRGTIVLAS
jgi:virulence factor Mce-like protein